MANLDFYGFEVNEILTQAVLDHGSIGFQQVNVLPIPDGYISAALEHNAPVEGDRKTGVVKAVLDQGYETDLTHYTAHGSFYLTAKGQDVTDPTDGATVRSSGLIKPGKYILSFTDSDKNHSIADQIYMGLTVATSDDRYCVNENVSRGEEVIFTIPEDFLYVYVSITINLNIAAKGEPVEIYPFVRNVRFTNVPFEPYKPSLQEQIDELRSYIVGREAYNETRIDHIIDDLQEIGGAQ